MVSGGPYGLEDIIGKAGYGRALLLLLLVPLVWSLPTSLMVGELASGMPEEGGFYCWVTARAGRLLGVPGGVAVTGGKRLRYGHLSGDFVLYLARVAPAWTAGSRGTCWALAVVVRLRGVESARGEGGGRAAPSGCSWCCCRRLRC